MINKKSKQWIKIFSIFPLITWPIFLSACGNSNDFYIANFESYMNPDLITEIQSEYSNTNFRYFPTNEDLERNFVRNYDVAVPSTYLMVKQAKLNLLEPLDWNKFNIYLEDNTTTPTTTKKITNSQEALKLFTDPVKTALTQVYDVNGNGKLGDPEDNLLNWGVPYFLQDLVLGYKGPKQQIPNIPELKPYNINSVDSTISNKATATSLTWESALNFFSDKVGKGLQYNKIAMIDDYRTIYSIPRIIQTSNSGNANVNPPSQDVSIADFQKTYEYMTDLFKVPNTFLLNSDSGVILNNFANKKGSDIGIMYSGDLLYAIQGGDEGNQMDPSLVHLIRPKDTLIVLDLMVINSRSSQKDLAYDIIKKITLEGVGVDALNGQKYNIAEKNINDEYIYGPMFNFSYVQYTSPLQVISHEVTQGDYFSFLEDKELEKLAVEIFSIGDNPSNTNMFEAGITDLQKSDMYYAYIRIKGKL